MPTSIDQARMTKNKINSKPLVKVEELLHSCFEVTETLPDESIEDVCKLKEKIKVVKEQQEKYDTTFANTQLRYVGLQKCGRLGVAGKQNWQWANSELMQQKDVSVDNHDMETIEQATQFCRRWGD